MTPERALTLLILVLVAIVLVALIFKIWPGG